MMNTTRMTKYAIVYFYALICAIDYQERCLIVSPVFRTAKLEISFNFFLSTVVVVLSCKS